MTTHTTLINALAYVAITGGKKFLHIRTRCALGPDLVGFQCEDLNKPFYFLTDKGWELARTSRLWKAHECLTELGYKPRKRYRHTTRHISYRRPDPDVGWRNEEERWGFAGSHGRAYAAEGEDPWKTTCVGQFRNGPVGVAA